MKNFAFQMRFLITWIETWDHLAVTVAAEGERSGLVVEPRTLEREVGGSIPTSTVLCP